MLFRLDMFNSNYLPPVGGEVLHFSTPMGPLVRIKKVPFDLKSIRGFVQKFGFTP